MKKIPVGIIGAGNMGEAIIKSLIKSRQYEVVVYEKNSDRLKFIIRRYAVKNLSLEELIALSKIIVICVKPQDFDALLFALNLKINSRQLVISIAAGITTEHLQKFFKPKVPVVRVMPNIPGLVGEGISAYCLGRFASSQSEKITRLIFSGLGQTIRLDEDKMDALTAVSGSGPGFIAYLTDAMIKAAEKAGFDAGTAWFLCLQTFRGTIELLTRMTLPPEELVRRVASKGGTTEAGLNVFVKKNIAGIIQEAINAATKRAKELSKK